MTRATASFAMPALLPPEITQCSRSGRRPNGRRADAQEVDRSRRVPRRSSSSSSSGSRPRRSTLHRCRRPPPPRWARPRRCSRAAETAHGLERRTGDGVVDTDELAVGDGAGSVTRSRAVATSAAGMSRCSEGRDHRCRRPPRHPLAHRGHSRIGGDCFVGERDQVGERGSVARSPRPVRPVDRRRPGTRRSESRAAPAIRDACARPRPGRTRQCGLQDPQDRRCAGRVDH